MATSVSICSNALLILAHNPSILSTTRTIALESQRISIPRSGDEMIRAHAWNCAIKRVILAPDVSDATLRLRLPIYPAGRLGAHAVRRRVRTGIRLSIGGRRILADTNTLPLRYVFRIPTKVAGMQA